MVCNLSLSQPSRYPSHPPPFIDVHPDIFAALQAYSARKGGKCLLPNVRVATLVCGMDKSFNESSVPYLHCLLPRGLCSITIKYAPLLKMSRGLCKAIASLITQSCSDIVTLDVDYSAFFETIDNNHLQDFIMRLPKLENICGSIDCAPTEAMRHLGSLPSLKSIQGLSLKQDTDLSAFATADDLFVSMEDLKLRTTGWDMAASLLRMMRCRFKQLDIGLDDFENVDEDLPLSHGLQDLISTLTSNVFLTESLTTIELVDQRREDPSAYAEVPSYTFRPFLSLRALQHVVVLIEGLDHLNDALLAEAALAWPDLMTLIIKASNSCFSLEGLIPVLKNCRKLTTLEVLPTAIPFDMSLLPVDGSASNTNITDSFWLRKAEADKMDPNALFACLTAMFPNVRRVERADFLFSRDFDSADEDEDEFREKWKIFEQMFEDMFPFPWYT